MFKNTKTYTKLSTKVSLYILTHKIEKYGPSMVPLNHPVKPTLMFILYHKKTILTKKCKLTHPNSNWWIKSGSKVRRSRVKLCYSRNMNRDRSRSPSRGQSAGKPYGKERYKASDWKKNTWSKKNILFVSKHFDKLVIFTQKYSKFFFLIVVVDSP